MDSNRLVIKNYPFFLWFIGLFLISLSAFMLFKQIETIPSLIGGVIGVVFLILPATTTVIVDKEQNLLMIRKHRLFSINNTDIPLKDITTIEIESTRSEGSTNSREVITLTSGKKVYLRKMYEGGIATIGMKRKVKRLREFIGLQEDGRHLTGNIFADNLINVRPSFKSLRQGKEDRFSWILESAFFGNLSILRWRSEEVRSDGQILCLLQKPEGSPNLFAGNGFLGQLSNQILRKGMAMYALPQEEGLKDLRLLETADPHLAVYYSLLTTDTEWGKRLLDPWAIASFTAWAERNPLQRVQNMDEGQAGSLAVMLCGRGLYLSLLAGDASQEEEMINLGIEFGKAVI